MVIKNLFEDEILDRIRAFKLKTVLFIGDNDIGPNTSAEELAHLLISAITSVKAKCTSIKFVTISQLLPRHQGTSKYYWEFYNDMALQVNQFN